MSARILAVAIALGIAFTQPASGQKPVEIRLATQALRKSSLELALNAMGAEWAEKTEKRVTLTIYPGGAQGSEEAVIRLMRPETDQLHAGLLTLAGLSNIDAAFGAFGLPFFFESDAEGQHVLERLTPLIEKRLDAKSFKLLAWAHAGWIQLFSKTEIDSLDKVKAARLFTTRGDDRLVQWYKSNGFTPVALTLGDIAPQLKIRGMIDAAPMPANLASAFQIDRDAPFMLDVHVAPLYGAIVMSSQAWGRIEAPDRLVVVAAAKAFERRVFADAPKLDRDAIDGMQKRGLKVTTLNPQAISEFRAEADRLVPTMRGSLVPADVYDAALRERDAFRKTRK